MKSDRESKTMPVRDVQSFNLGNKLLKLGKYKEAIKHYEETIINNPTHYGAYNNKGMALNELEKFEQAIDCFNNAIKYKQNYSKAYNNKGNSLHNLRRFKDAIKEFENAIMYEPNEPSFYVNKGNALEALNKHQEAIEQYNSAIQIDPMNARAFSCKAITLNKLDDLEGAFQCIEEALKIDPMHVTSHYYLGVIYFERKHQSSDYFGKSIQEFEMVLQFYPNHIDALYKMGFVYQEKNDTEQALECFRRVVDLSPNFLEAHFHLGNLLLKAQYYKESLIYFENIISSIKKKKMQGKKFTREEEEQFQITTVNKALSLLYMRQYEKSVETLEGYLSFFSGNEANILYYIAISYYLSSNLKKSLEYLDNAIKEDMNYSDAYCQKGIIYNQMKNPIRAIIEFDLSIKFRKDHSYSYLNKAISYIQLEKLEEALNLLDQSLSYSNLMESYYFKGVIMKKFKNYEEAIKLLNIAIDLYENGAKEADRIIVENNYKYIQPSKKSILNFKQLMYKNKGLALLKLQRYEESISTYKAAKMSSLFSNFYIGIAHFHEQNYFAALYVLELVMKSPYLSNLAQKDRDRAEAHLRLCQLILKEFHTNDEFINHLEDLQTQMAYIIKPNLLLESLSSLTELIMDVKSSPTRILKVIEIGDLEETRYWSLMIYKIIINIKLSKHEKQILFQKYEKYFRYDPLNDENIRANLIDKMLPKVMEYSGAIRTGLLKIESTKNSNERDREWVLLKRLTVSMNNLRKFFKEWPLLNELKKNPNLVLPEVPVIHASNFGYRELTEKAECSLLIEGNVRSLTFLKIEFKPLCAFGNVAINNNGTYGREVIVECLNKAVAGFNPNPSYLIKAQKSSQLTIFKAIGNNRANLQYLLEQHSNYINYVDINNFSEMIILSILSNPKNATPENIHVEIESELINPQQSDYYSSNKQSKQVRIKKLHFTGIDCDMGFSETHWKQKKVKGTEKEFINTRNILYFFPQMDQSFGDDFRREFLSKQPEQILINFIYYLYLKNVEFVELFDRDILLQSEAEDLGIPVTLPRGLISYLFSALSKINNFLKEYEKATHRDLLNFMQPKVADCYRQTQFSVLQRRVDTFSPETSCENLLIDSNNIEILDNGYDDYVNELNHSSISNGDEVKNEIIVEENKVNMEFQQIDNTKILDCMIELVKKSLSESKKKYKRPKELFADISNQLSNFSPPTKRTFRLSQSVYELMQNINFSKLPVENVILTDIFMKLSKFIDTVVFIGSSISCNQLISYLKNCPLLTTLYLSNCKNISFSDIIQLLYSNERLNIYYNLGDLINNSLKPQDDSLDDRNKYTTIYDLFNEAEIKKFIFYKNYQRKRRLTFQLHSTNLVRINDISNLLMLILIYILRSPFYYPINEVIKLFDYFIENGADVNEYSPIKRYQVLHVIAHFFPLSFKYHEKNTLQNMYFNSNTDYSMSELDYNDIYHRDSESDLDLFNNSDLDQNKQWLSVLLDYLISKRNAKLNGKDNNGKTPFEIAFSRSDINGHNQYLVDLLQPNNY